MDGQPAERLAKTTRSASSDIALLPEFCSRGIGTTVLRGLQSEAAAAGKPLRIHVERFNPALRLYERLGFRQIDDRGVYLFMEWTGSETLRIVRATATCLQAENRRSGGQEKNHWFPPDLLVSC